MFAREDAAPILRILFDRHIDLRKLMLTDCELGEDSTDIITNIVDLYPKLEVLSLDCCDPLNSAAYSLIPRLKKLSELNISYCQVHYVFVKLLQTDVCICEHMQQNSDGNTFYIIRQEGDLIHF
jgi:hypothetical protein